MTVKRLKEILKDFEDDKEIFIRNTENKAGNTALLKQVQDSYMWNEFGFRNRCLILHTIYTETIKIEDVGNIDDLVKIV